MIKPDLLAILRCPACVREKEGRLLLYKDSWLICRDCGRKYPIVEDIPIMLLSEGENGNKPPMPLCPSLLPVRNDLDLA